jgi:hypothetical protein
MYQLTETALPVELVIVSVCEFFRNRMYTLPNDGKVLSLMRINMKGTSEYDLPNVTVISPFPPKFTVPFSLGTIGVICS